MLLRKSRKSIHLYSQRQAFQYGQLDILAEYAGLHTPQVKRRLALPHGWSAPGRTDMQCRKFARQGIDYWNWNKCNPTSKYCVCNPIGSAWLYLTQEGKNLAEGTGVNWQLFCMPHSSTSSRESVSEKYHRLLLEWINAVRDRNSEPVLLFHWADFVNEYTIQPFRDSGFKLVCAGFSGNIESFKPDTNLSRRKHLYLIKEFLSNSKRIEFFEPSTVTLYAFSSGVEIGLYEKSFSNWSPLSDDYYTVSKEKMNTYATEFEFLANWSLTIASKGSAERKEFADKILGATHKLSREKMSEELQKGSSLIETLRFQLLS